MSAKGRPEREYRSAQHEGSPVSRAPGRSRKRGASEADALQLPLGLDGEPDATQTATTKPTDATSATDDAWVRLQPDSDGPWARLQPDSSANLPGPPPRDTAQIWLAQGFADHIVNWSRRLGASPDRFDALRRAAFAVSIATGAGHACINLRDIAAECDSLRAALLASKVVGTPTAPGACPLVLDDEDRLYLHRYFDYERRIANRLMHRAARLLDPAAEQRLAALLDGLFARNAAAAGDAPDWQKLAAALAVFSDVTVISGGPGTGKTTTVVNLLACLLELDADCRIALAAPTGKAAARLQDAIRQRAAHLPEAVRARLPAESFTIHRLLGVVPESNAFRHHAGNPLAIDVLVIDEASMLDLALAAKLFDAVPLTARIILLGDKDQLAAVESGAVFSELCADPTLSDGAIASLSRVCAIPAARIIAPAPIAATPLTDSVVWFTRNFRFAADSGIGRLAHEINRGQPDALLAHLRGPRDAAVTWLDEGGPVLAPEVLDRLRAGYGPYVAALLALASAAADGAELSSADHAASDSMLTRVFDAFDRFRILCAEREGPRGVRGLNETMTHRCREALDERWPAAARSPWYYGRPVMVLRNDYVLKLYNGDIGITLPDDAGNLMVHFRETDGSFRAVAPVRLPDHETAFATTVHKAQGSEFDDVALVLPAQESRVATRELVYTAVTRARSAVVLVASAEVLANAVSAPSVRHSGLIARLREAARADRER